MRQRLVKWSHMVCRLCELQSSRLSQEDVNEYSPLRKEVGVRTREGFKHAPFPG